MKSFSEWQNNKNTTSYRPFKYELNEEVDPEWENLKYVWGTGNQKVDRTLVSKLKLKINSITDQYIKELHDPNITTFAQLPSQMRDSLAQALVVATLKAFYSSAGDDASGSGSMLNTKKLGAFQQDSQPAGEMNAPTGWTGK